MNVLYQYNYFNPLNQIDNQMLQMISI